MVMVTRDILFLSVTYGIVDNDNNFKNNLLLQLLEAFYFYYVLSLSGVTFTTTSISAASVILNYVVF